jgi:hypothetical protein
MPDDYDLIKLPFLPVSRTVEDIERDVYLEVFTKRQKEFERRLPSELVRIASGEKGTL